MAHVNYQFEKRKRDLEKKRKQEAKRRRKAERKKGRGTEPPAPSEMVPPSGNADDTSPNAPPGSLT